MALNQVSQQVLDAVYDRLSAANGFNAGVAAQAPLYGLSPTFCVIDWSTTSNNFFMDQIDSEDLDSSAPITFPFACLYTLESKQMGLQKFAQFSGLVQCVFEVSLSWTDLRGKSRGGYYASCIEDVMLDVMNRVGNQNWPAHVSYNGNIQCRPGRTAYGQQNWKKKIGFLMTFQVDE